jgi:hypothetical protein
MITCGKCHHVNPMGTVFCHACGERITVDAFEVMQSVALTKQTQWDAVIYYWGRNALSLCTFLLVIAIIINWVMVPPVPSPEFPDLPQVALFDSMAPQTGDAGKTTAATPVETSLIKQSRLVWRQQQGTYILSSLGLDFGRIRRWQQSIIDSQQANGSFAGGDTDSATALAALALQAYPSSDATVAAAAKARAYLAPKAKAMIGMEPLKRALITMALLDAEELSENVRVNLGVMMVDGSAAEWQAASMMLIPAPQRPPQMYGLTGKLTTPVWNGFFQALGFDQTNVDIEAFQEPAGMRIANGEERFYWAMASWFHPVAVKDMATMLKAWSNTDPAPVSAALEKACGKNASTALALLTVTAPVRAPALALNPLK